ncbi:glutathione S-transferase family protein, partial [Brucella melitensis]
MLTLFHHPMSSGSRYVRLILGEYGVEAELIEERPWSRRKEFLALNPAGTLPVLLAENDLPVVGATVIAEYLDETRGALKRNRRLLPESPMERAEVRRLVDWFLLKFENEVTRHIARERVFKLQMAAEMGGSAPDSTAIRAARTNIRQHMKYIDWLAA